MNKNILLVPVIALVFALAGCTAPNPYGDTYGTSDTRQAQKVYYGTITDLSAVTISGDDHHIGTGAGAVIGAVAGRTVGGGHGTDLASIGMGLLGGYLGDKAGKKLSKRQGVNLLIKLESNDEIAVVQEANKDMIFQVGQRVRVFVDGKTYRVVPVN